VIVLPNNKNIILAAEQAISLTNKKVHVIPTRFITQGVACLLNFMDSDSLEENLTSMNETISNIHTGQVTFAARDTVVNGKDVQEGDILCLYNGDIVSTGKDLHESAKSLAGHMLAKGGDTFSVYYGEGITEAQASKLCCAIQKDNPNIEILPYDGKQPLYYYIFSVE
jgi:dihydroxyacetone kinase-like predicted kinase